jgi:hypothetical protein
MLSHNIKSILFFGGIFLGERIVRVCITLNKDLFNDVKHKAIDKGITQTELITKYIELGLTNEE